jgi:hypothetical protein
MNQQQRAVVQQALEALEMFNPKFPPLVYTETDRKRDESINALHQLLEQQPVQEPDWLDKKAIEPDWSHVWLLIKAASYASSRGHLSGTTNWGAAMSAYLRHETPPAQPAPVQEPVPHPFEDPSVISALAWAAGLIQQEYHAGHNGADSWLMNYADKQGELIRLADHRKWEKVHGRWQPITTPPRVATPLAQQANKS